jgi:hypothetical protein
VHEYDIYGNRNNMHYIYWTKHRLYLQQEQVCLSGLGASETFHVSSDLNKIRVTQLVYFRSHRRQKQCNLLVQISVTFFTEILITIAYGHHTYIK